MSCLFGFSSDVNAYKKVLKIGKSVYVYKDGML